MTPYQQRFVMTILATAKVDKTYANWSIRQFSELDPYQLSGLKELVLQAVKSAKSDALTLEKLD